MQYPEQLLRTQEGAWLLEKSDPAFGPLKENGMSLLNGAMREFHRRVQKQAKRSGSSDGTAGPQSSYENSNKWDEWVERRWRRQSGGQVMSRTATNRRGRDPREEETRQQSHKVKLPPRAVPLSNVRRVSSLTVTILGQKETINLASGGSSGQKTPAQLCILRDVWLNFFLFSFLLTDSLWLLLYWSYSSAHTCCSWPFSWRIWPHCALLSSYKDN